jgi:hypothetical protein
LNRTAEPDRAAPIHLAIEELLDSYRRRGAGEREIVDALHRSLGGSAAIAATAKIWAANGGRDWAGRDPSS